MREAWRSVEKQGLRGYRGSLAAADVFFAGESGNLG